MVTIGGGLRVSVRVRVRVDITVGVSVRVRVTLSTRFTIRVMDNNTRFNVCRSLLESTTQCTFKG